MFVQLAVRNCFRRNVDTVIDISCTGLVRRSTKFRKPWHIALVSAHVSELHYIVHHARAVILFRLSLNSHLYIYLQTWHTNLKLANAPFETKCRAVVEIPLHEVSKYLKFEPSSTHVELAQTTHCHRYLNLFKNKNANKLH
jgi:hypothetical protein